MTFYKIENGKAQVGQGTIIPDGFIEYVVGQEPLELVEALAQEAIEAELNGKIAEAKTYLSSTDFYMTVDKYAELDEARKIELTAKRAEARELINKFEAELGGL